MDKNKMKRNGKYIAWKLLSDMRFFFYKKDNIINSIRLTNIKN